MEYDPVAVDEPPDVEELEDADELEGDALADGDALPFEDELEDPELPSLAEVDDADEPEALEDELDEPGDESDVNATWLLGSYGCGMNSGTTYSAKAATRIAAPTAIRTTGSFDFFATGEFFAACAAFCACPTAAPTAWAAGGVLFHVDSVTLPTSAGANTSTTPPVLGISGMTASAASATSFTDVAIDGLSAGCDSATTAVPHSAQNRSPSCSSLPHCVQNAMSTTSFRLQESRGARRDEIAVDTRNHVVQEHGQLV